MTDDHKALVRKGDFPSPQESDVADIHELEEDELLLERWSNWAEAVDR